MFRRCVCFLVFITCLQASVGWAAIGTSVLQNINFGTFIQTNMSSSVTISTDGNTNLSSLNSITSGNSGLINFQTDIASSEIGQAAEITIQDLGQVIFSNTQGCTITLSNLTANPNFFRFSREGGWYETSQDVYFGATLTITGFCKEGQYTTVASVPFDVYRHGLIGGGETTTEYTNLSFSISFQDIISIANKQDINFGSMISPSSDVVVNVSYSGQRSASGNIYLLNDVPPSNGIFTITGQVGRTIYLGLPSDVLIYNEQGNTLTVNNFVSSTGDSFVLDVDTVDAAIGASLNVPRDSPSGNYSGTYTITVSY